MAKYTEAELKLLGQLEYGEAKAKKAGSLHNCDRQLRVLVNNLRKKGEPICSSSQGYYLAANDLELRQTLANIEARARELDRVCAGLERGRDRLEG